MTAEEAMIALLEKRGPGKSICPSEAARLLSNPVEDWRKKMGTVHSAVEAMAGQGQITMSWKGERLSQRRGAYRIAHRQPTDQSAE